MKSLKGKVALVTGASRGIGKGIAMVLGEAGATVYITARTLTKNSSPKRYTGSLNQTVREIKAVGGKAIPIKCDHSIDEDVKKVFKRIAGLAYDCGNWLCHETNLCRELGIPAVVGLDGIHQIQDGERLRVDGSTGRVYRLDFVEKK
ncbi:MAG: SDR family NAD(P)-dependent oxidoreductase [Candidatus Latescibacteria bacterium]|jgi:NAD(P)-dependent dehydrogenase (short-subunit alcohol dehydrogenase family)|nr:SDR family NAD(P)-dependent oxidoreductase [Candidatus Latescibacterota bacterium]